MWLRFYSQARVGRHTRFIETARVFNIGQQQELIQVGSNCTIGGELLTFRHGGMISIGDWCYVGSGSRIWSAANIRIGDRVLISHNVNIHDCDSHPQDAESRHLQFSEIHARGHPRSGENILSKPVIIEDDVWIGFNVTVLKGVRIGARSIVAAGSMVTRDVPADCVFVGNKVKRYLDAENG
jgi:acetyltransferase-like isoleucine patch superfamily enzyme